MTAERAPRPYSTLRDGKIVWVYPGESLADRLNGRVRDAKLKFRSRLETDDEVRARLDAEIKRRRQAEPWWIWFYPRNTSKDLDAELKGLGLPPRQMIDEEA